MNKQVKGTVLAAAVAGLFMGGQAVASDDGMKPAEGKVKCMGVNECKGKGACGTATHGCAGQNACKGKGWIQLSAADCKAKGGTEVK